MTGTSAKNENLGTDAERHFFDYAAFGSSLRGDRSLTNYAFTGQVQESKTGQQYQRARFYDPTNSRWLSPDTVSDVPNGSYSYCAGNPVNAVDPTGLFSMIEISSVSAGQAEAMMALRFNLGSGCTLGITPESVALENLGTGTGIAEGYLAITMFIIKFIGVYVISTIFPIIGALLALVSVAEVAKSLWASTQYVLTQPGVPTWVKVYVICADIVFLILAAIGLVKCGAAAASAFQKIFSEAKGASVAEAEVARGAGAGGKFTPGYEFPEGNGQVWTAPCPISQKDFKQIVVEGVQNKERVVILTGTHGTPAGRLVPEPKFLQDDIKAFEKMPGVEIKDVTKLTDTEIQALIEGRGRIIGAYCYSEQHLRVVMDWVNLCNRVKF